MWDAFKDAIFWCIDAMYGFVADWGLAIIIVTLILRLILFPLMQKQIRSSYRMQQFTPRIQEIQEKYADDQQRQAEEMQKVYAEIGFNPITGCLPLFLQMPIFVALFQVLQEMGSRTEGMTYSFYNVLPSLALFAFRDVRPGFLGVLALRHPSSSVCILHLPALLASADGYEQPAEDADHDYDGYHVPVHAVAWLGFSYRRFVVLGNFFRIRRSAAGNLY